MERKSIFTKLFYPFLFCLALFPSYHSYGQFNIGGFYSNFNLRAVNLKCSGFGITGEYEANEKTVYALTFAYNSKAMPTDSVLYSPTNGGNNYYIKAQSKYSFMHLSANFYEYLIGSADYSNRVSFFLGAGLSVLQTQAKTNYESNFYPSENNKSITEGFEFLIGGDVKLSFFKIFFRGRANFFLKYPVPFDDTVIPLLTNTQIGFLVPLSGQNVYTKKHAKKKS